MALRLLLMLRWVAVAIIIISLALIVVRWKYPYTRRSSSQSVYDYWREKWLSWRKNRRLRIENSKRLTAFRRKTALVIDPDEKSRRVLQWKLESLGCSVATAATGRQGLAEIESNRPDIIFIDALLPDMTSQGFYRSITLRDVPIIFVGVLDADWDITANLGPNVECLSKPFDPEAAAVIGGMRLLHG